MAQLIEPHGGTLCDLLIHGKNLEHYKKDSIHLQSITLNLSLIHI